jgi:iron-sulfur cluster assembly protein
MSVVKETTTVLVTEQAAKVVADLLVAKNVPDYGLRVFVSGGGCSGMQYGMALEAEARAYDNVIESHGIKIFIDPTSMMYVDGATIDYEDSLMGGGFKIENPNAVSSCGCGHSFKTEDGAEAQGAACGSGCGC